MISAVLLMPFSTAEAQEKRPVIGKICCDYADNTIFTTDDPRDEDPKDICDMMVSDVKTNNYDIRNSFYKKLLVDYLPPALIKYIDFIYFFKNLPIK